MSFLSNIMPIAQRAAPDKERLDENGICILCDPRPYEELERG